MINEVEGSTLTELRVCSRYELDDDTRRVVSVNGREIVVFAHGGKVYALSNICLHMGGPIGRGEIIPKVEVELGEHQTYVKEYFSETTTHIVCPWHGFEYDIATGCMAGDKTKRIPVYETFERDGEVYVRI